MIFDHRKTHFYASIALAVALPVLFVAGLVLRPTIPTVDESVDDLFAIAHFPTDTSTLDGVEPLVDGGVQLRATVIAANSQAFLEVQPVQVIQAADILVYWQEGDRLPAAPSEDAPVIDPTAVLLGHLSGTSRRRFPLPATLKGQTGHLILYSRGTNARLAMFPLTL